MEITEEQAEEILDSSGERDWESEAAAEGWVPQEDFNGPEDKWVDAETFVKRGEEILPIVNARLRREQERNADLERKVDRVMKDTKRILDDKERDYQNQIAQLKARQRQAAEEGDLAEYDKAEQAIQEAQKEAVPRQQEPPELAEWRARHPEYQVAADGSPMNEFTAIVNGFGDLAIKTVGEDAPIKVYLDELDRRIDAYQRSTKPRTPKVGSSRPVKQSKDSKTYDNLPPDAKQACDDFVQAGILTKEEYVQRYEWE